MKSSAKAKTLYLDGDAIWCKYMDAAIRDHRPDVILVNAACAAAAPKATVIASHMDNVGHATVWRRDIREFTVRNGTTGRLLVPEDGGNLLLISSACRTTSRETIRKCRSATGRHSSRRLPR